MCVLSNIWRLQQDSVLLKQFNTTANQVCHQFHLKHSREADMDKKKDNDSEDVDSTAYSKNLLIIIFFKTVKWLIAALQSFVLQHQCCQHLLAEAVQVHQGCPHAVQLHGRDECCFEGICSKVAFGIYCHAASRIFARLPWEECLAACGDVCLAALGMYALLPLRIWSFAAQRKENNLAPRRGLFSVAPCRTIQLGSQERIVQLVSLRMFGAWHPRGLSSLAAPTSRASSPSSRTKRNSFPLGSVSAIFDA